MRTKCLVVLNCIDVLYVAQFVIHSLPLGSNKKQAPYNSDGRHQKLCAGRAEVVEYGGQRVTG